MWISRVSGILLMVAVSAVLLKCEKAAGQAKSLDPLPDPFERLLPLHTRLEPPRPGEWLAEHKEAGQSYAEYLRAIRSV